jgi:hypothetical protein
MFNTFSAVHKAEQLSVIFRAVTRQNPSSQTLATDYHQDWLNQQKEAA